MYVAALISKFKIAGFVLGPKSRSSLLTLRFDENFTAAGSLAHCEHQLLPPNRQMLFGDCCHKGKNRTKSHVLFFDHVNLPKTSALAHP